MVPGIRIEVTAIRTAGAITTDGGIGIATLETAWRYTVGRNLLRRRRSLISAAHQRQQGNHWLNLQTESKMIMVCSGLWGNACSMRREAFRTLQHSENTAGPIQPTKLA
jgi:hypothetical protein